MKAMIRPYWTAFRIRARLETQYRAAAIGGLVTQVFFGLVLVYLYVALFQGGDEQMLRETVTYVWLQQMFFRMMLAGDAELDQQIRTGGIAYILCRPVDQYAYWLCRCLALKVVGVAMRALPMLLVQFLLPADIRMMLPQNGMALCQFLLGLSLGAVLVSEIENICAGITMYTLDNKGPGAMIRLAQMVFAGNVIPLTLFPDSVQTLIRYQPFAQALDAPTRMYLRAQPLGEWLFNTGVQLGWIAVIWLCGRWLWNRRLNHMIVQGG